MPSRWRRGYRQSKYLQRGFCLTVTEAGILVSTENGQIRTPWSDYIKWKEGKAIFLLYLSDALFQVVPKRFFATAAEVDQFRDTLKSRVNGK